MFQGKKSAHQPCDQIHNASPFSLECVQMSHHLAGLQLIWETSALNMHNHAAAVRRGDSKKGSEPFRTKRG